MEECGQCGFRYDLGQAAEAGDAITTGAADIATMLRDVDASALRERRPPDVWSPLEYACHVRDVLLVQRERLLAARRRDTPRFEPMGRDERVDHDGYADQDPSDVARQLEDGARLFANVLARLGPDDWDRTRSTPTPSRPSGRCAGSRSTRSTRCTTTASTSSASCPPATGERTGGARPRAPFGSAGPWLRQLRSGGPVARRSAWGRTAERTGAYPRVTNRSAGVRGPPGRPRRPTALVSCSRAGSPRRRAPASDAEGQGVP